MSRHFSKDDIVMAKTHEKMLNVTIHQRQVEIKTTTRYILEWLSPIYQQTVSAGKDAEKI